LVNDSDKSRYPLGPLHVPRHPLALLRLSLALFLSAVWRIPSGERARAVFKRWRRIRSRARTLADRLFGLFSVSRMWLAARPGGSQGSPMRWPLSALAGRRDRHQLAGRDRRAAICTVVMLTTLKRALDIAVIAFLPVPAAASEVPFGWCFKLDLALDGPIPWAAEECTRAATVHLGGTFDEIAAAERAVSRREHPEKPFVLLAQQTLFDPTRAPEGQHTVWAYCHVPSGSSIDMTGRIEAQIERFAPGFRKRILARSTHTAVEMERYNPNYVGGDINSGVQDWRQFFTRPTARWVPYSTPAEGIFLCSSSTPPGGGVHGMCGYHAARAALKNKRLWKNG
jgi:hypothetical protein